jgi:hypothetical protein
MTESAADFSHSNDMEISFKFDFVQAVEDRRADRARGKAIRRGLVKDIVKTIDESICKKRGIQLESGEKRGKNDGEIPGERLQGVLRSNKFRVEGTLEEGWIKSRKS